MSQEKVDRYKKEKKNRAKTMRREKVRKALLVLVVALGVGALLGIPIGKGIYRYEKKKAEANATVSTLHYNEWFDEYWVENYSDYFTGIDYVTEDESDSVSDVESEADTEAEDTSDEGAASEDTSSAE